MPASRHDTIDCLRGLAVVWMTLYHFCFDLNHFGWIHQQMLVDPVWTMQRTLIVSLFLFCAGLSQAVALARQPRRFAWVFWRRWAQVALAALLVSLGSWWMFHQSYIYFGVLHGIAVMLILLRCVSGMGRLLWPLGLLFVTLPFVAAYAHGLSQHWLDFLNEKAFNWLGLISVKPFTQDYVPVLPWLGVMCWGLAAGQWLLKNRPQWLSRPCTRQPLPALALLGRWSLSYYLLHQPALMGLMSAVAWLLTRP